MSINHVKSIPYLPQYLGFTHFSTPGSIAFVLLLYLVRFEFHSPFLASHSSYVL